MDDNRNQPEGKESTQRLPGSGFYRKSFDDGAGPSTSSTPYEKLLVEDKLTESSAEQANKEVENLVGYQERGRINFNQENSNKLGEKRIPKIPKPELIEWFLFEPIDEFKEKFNEILEEIPKKHPVSYDEFFIYFFLGSAITIPNRLKEKTGIKKIYFNINLEPTKNIKLIFDVNKNNQNRKLIFRNINVIVESGQNNFNKDFQTFSTYSEAEIWEIAEKLSLTDQIKKLPEIDEKSFYLSLTKSERLLKISKDIYIKKALQKIQEESNGSNGSNEEIFKAVDWESEELKKWFFEIDSNKPKFEIALEKLSQEAKEVKDGVEEIFTSFIEICREKKNFPQKQRNKNEKKGQSRNDQYKESRYHGFIYGTLIMNFKSLYYLNCYVERFSGMGGGADLVLISRKDGYRNRNLNAVPVIVELKVDKNAEDALKQVKSNIFTNVRTFAEKAIIAGVNFFSGTKKLPKILLPQLKIEEQYIPTSEGFITLLLKNIKNPNLSQNIQKDLKYLHYLIPAIDRISFPKQGYEHRTYLSRLILGEILSSSSNLIKLVFLYKDKNINKLVTTFLLYQNNKIVILNIIELNTKEQHENNFTLNKAICLPKSNKAANVDSIYQIIIKIDFRNSIFYNMNSKPKSYLQETIEVKKFNLGEYKDLPKYDGELKEIGHVDCISLTKAGIYKVVEQEDLINSLNKVLFSIKDLITGVTEGDELNNKRTNINFLAVIQGLFTGKQNMFTGKQNRANKKNQIMKILPKVNFSYKEIIDLAISIANIDKSTIENEAVFIYTSKPDTITEYLLKSVTDKILPKLYLLKFNIKAKVETDLITRINTKTPFIRHDSCDRSNFIDDLVNYIADDDIMGFNSLLNNEINEYLKSDTDREQTLNILIQIANTLSDRGGNILALEINLKILEIQKDILYPDNPKILTTKNNIAMVYFGLGRFAEALNFFQEISCYTDNFNGNIALVHEKLGNYDVALQILKSLFQKTETDFGTDNPDTLRCMNSIGLVYRSQGKYKEALYFFEKVYKKRHKLLGCFHPNTLNTWSNMALTIANMGEFEKALEIFKKCFDMQKNILGPKHPSTLNTRNNMASVLEKHKNYEEAFYIYKEVYENRKNILGFDHPDTLLTHHNMATTLSFQNKFVEALEILFYIYNIENREEFSRSNALVTKITIGDIQSIQKKYKEALITYQEIYEERKINLTENHKDTLFTKCKIGSILVLQNKYDEALKIFQEILEKQREVLKCDHADILNTINYIDITLNNQNKGWKMLHLAAFYGSGTGVEYLLKEGYEINIFTKNGYTPLHLAVENNNKGTVNALIKYYTNKNPKQLKKTINFQTKLGKRTSLHIAALKDNIEIVKILLNNEANYKSKDIRHKTPLDLAKPESDVKKLLSSYPR